MRKFLETLSECFSGQGICAEVGHSIRVGHHYIYFKRARGTVCLSGLFPKKYIATLLIKGDALDTASLHLFYEDENEEDHIIQLAQQLEKSLGTQVELSYQGGTQEGG